METNQGLEMKQVDMLQQSDNQLSVFRSYFNVRETMDRIEDNLIAMRVTVFDVIDQGELSRKAGLDLPPTEVILFGAPDIGGQLMMHNRHIAIDLPLKILVWEDTEGGVWAGYTPASVIAARFHMEQHPVIEEMDALLEDIVLNSVHAGIEA